MSKLCSYKRVPTLRTLETLTAVRALTEWLRCMTISQRTDLQWSCLRLTILMCPQGTNLLMEEAESVVWKLRLSLALKLSLLS